MVTGIEDLPSPLNFTGMNLTKTTRAELMGLDLRGANFTKADISGLDFSGFNLRGAIFNGTKAEGTKFCNAQMQKVQIDHADPHGIRGPDAMFLGADFTGADLSDAHIARGRFENAIFTDTKLHHAHIIEGYSRFDGAKFAGADFRGAYHALMDGTGTIAPLLKESSPLFRKADIKTAQFGELPGEQRRVVAPSRDGSIRAKAGPFHITFTPGGGPMTEI